MELPNKWNPCLQLCLHFNNKFIIQGSTILKTGKVAKQTSSSLSLKGRRHRDVTDFWPKLSWKLAVVNLIHNPRPQTTVININYLKTRRNNLKSLASIFQVAIRFYPHHLQPLRHLLTVSANYSVI